MQMFCIILYKNNTTSFVSETVEFLFFFILSVMISVFPQWILSIPKPNKI